MGEFSVEGDELKKLIKVAKKRPLAFAMSPGKDEDSFVFALHRKRPADVLARAVKKESTSNKIAFGLCAVEKKVMSLTCERELPGLAKKLKKWLKKQKAPLNVRILDENGNVIDDDIEDLPDDPLYDDDDGDDAELFEDADETQEDPRVEELRKKILALVPQIRTLEGPKLAQLQAAAKSALEKINASDLEGAAQLISAIEVGLQKAEGAPKASDEAKQQTAELAEELKTLRPKCMAAPPPANEKLMKAWEMATQKLRGQDFDGAGAAIKAISDALGKLEDPQTESDPLQAEWETLWSKLSPEVLKALKADVPNAQKLRAAMMMADESAAAGNFKKAIAVAQRLEGMLNEALQEPKAPAAPFFDFTKSRLLWSKARDVLRAEMTKLGKAIVKDCKGDDFEGIDKAVNDLQAYLDPIDERLDDALDALIQESDPGRRAALRQNCIGAISAYRAELNTGIFNEIDDGNGFTSVKIKRTAISALAAVEKELEKEAQLAA